jgi:hypothetical protein
LPDAIWQIGAQEKSDGVWQIARHPAATFPLKKRLMEWGEAALQNQLGHKDDES